MAAVDDIIQVTVFARQASQTLESVFHYRITAVGAGDSALNLATAFDGTVMPVWKSKMSAQWAYEYTQAQHVWPLPIPVAQLIATNLGVGGVATDAVPLPGALVMTKRTAFAGRKERGRVYMSGIPSTYVVNSIMSGTGNTALQLVSAELQVSLVVGGWTFSPIVYHRSTHGWTTITSVEPRSSLRAQRRREVGKGI